MANLYNWLINNLGYDQTFRRFQNIHFQGCSGLWQIMLIALPFIARFGLDEYILLKGLKSICLSTLVKPLNNIGGPPYFIVFVFTPRYVIFKLYCKYVQMYTDKL